MTTTSTATIAAAELMQMLEVSRHLARPFDLSTLLNEIINCGRRVIGADRGTVFLYDQAARELHSVVATGSKELRFSIDKGIAGDCARTRQVVNVPDCYADPRFNPEFDRKSGYRTCNMISVPVVGLDEQLVGVMQLLNSTRGPAFDEGQTHLASILAAQAAAAIQRTRLQEEQLVKRQMERDLELAKQIQRRALPQALPEIAGYSLASFFQPADDTGGDIYDLFPLDQPHDDEPPTPTHNGRMILTLADATGHGIGPALSVTQFRAMLRIGFRQAPGLDRMFNLVNRQLCDDLPQSRFITAFIGVLDALEHQITYHSGGQAPLLHFQAATRSCRWLDATTVPLGIMKDLPLAPAQAIALAPGDVFILLTDGFYEYQNAAGDMFGTEHVAAAVTAAHTGAAQDILAALMAALKTFAHGAPQGDDLTAVILKRDGPR
ncbi:MAG: GAF domain-containing SpoIIE family protein phosphatase [Phycisphaeraceae bacterium]